MHYCVERRDVVDGMGLKKWRSGFVRLVQAADVKHVIPDMAGIGNTRDAVG